MASPSFVPVFVTGRSPVQRQDERRGGDGVVGTGGDDAGADGEVFDDVAAPAVRVLFDGRPDDAVRLELLRFGLHPGEGEFTGVVDGLGVGGHLDVLADLGEPRLDALVADVVDAVAHDERDGPVAGLDQGPEVLAAQVTGEGAAIRRTMAFAAAGLDGGADGDKLGQVLAPLLPPHLQADADDAVRADAIGFLLHARHRQLAGVVHGLGQRFQLHALVHGGLLPADVIDTGPDDQAERVEAGFFDQQELVDGQVTGEQALLVRAGLHGSEAASGVGGKALLGAGRVGIGHDGILLD